MKAVSLRMRAGLSDEGEASLFQKGIAFLFFALPCALRSALTTPRMSV